MDMHQCRALLCALLPDADIKVGVTLTDVGEFYTISIDGKILESSDNWLGALRDSFGSSMVASF